MKRHRRLSVKHGLFLTYALIFAVPFLLLAVSLVVASVQNLSQQYLDDARYRLNSTASSIDASIDNLEQLSHQLMQSSWMRRLLLYENSLFRDKQIWGHIDTYTLNEYRSYLSSYDTVDEFISGIALYLPSSRTIITSNGMYFDYGTFMPLKPAAWSDADWERAVSTFHISELQVSDRIRTLVNNETDGLLFLHSMSASASDVRGNLVMLVRQSTLSARVASLLESLPGASLLMRTADGQVALCEGQLGAEDILRIEQDAQRSPIVKHFYDLAEGQFTIGKAPGGGNGFSFVLAVPFATVIGANATLFALLCAAMLGILTAGILAAYMMAIKTYRPLGLLIRKVDGGARRPLPNLGGAPHENEYDALNTAVSKIMDDNRQLESAFKAQQPLLLKMQLWQLLQPPTQPDGAPNSLERDLVMGFHRFLHARFRCMVVRMQAPASGSPLHLPRNTSDIEMIETAFGNENVIICCFDDPPAFDHAVERIQQQLQENPGLQVALGIGTECALDHLHSSYRQAVAAVEHSFVLGFRRIYTVSHEDMECQDQQFEIPLGLREQLMNALRLGKLDSACKIAQDIVDDNLNEHKAPPKAMKALMHCLRQIGTQAMQSLGFDAGSSLPPPLALCPTLDQEMAALRGTYLQICEVAQLRELTSERQSYLKIKAYIDKNLCDPALSLQMISDSFGYTAPYFSRLFKSIYKQNFKDFISQARIEMSKQYLTDSRLSIAKIAQLVGYTSDVTFRRLFKHYESINASDFRRLHGVCLPADESEVELRADVDADSDY